MRDVIKPRIYKITRYKSLNLAVTLWVVIYSNHKQ